MPDLRTLQRRKPQNNAYFFSIPSLSYFLVFNIDGKPFPHLLGFWRTSEQQQSWVSTKCCTNSCLEHSMSFYENSWFGKKRTCEVSVCLYLKKIRWIFFGGRKEKKKRNESVKIFLSLLSRSFFLFVFTVPFHFVIYFEMNWYNSVIIFLYIFFFCRFLFRLSPSRLGLDSCWLSPLQYPGIADRKDIRESIHLISVQLLATAEKVGKVWGTAGAGKALASLY